MKIFEVTALLKMLGWVASKDEVGDHIASYNLPDRTVGIIYGLRQLRNEQLLWVMCATSTEGFSRSCAEIDLEYGNSADLKCRWNNPKVRAPEIFEEHVRQASDQAISWSQDQDLDKALQEHAASPTNAPGVRPILHLAALALLGDVAKLKSYQISFEAGDRLGFANYVTKDYIDRAVVLAKQGAARG